MIQRRWDRFREVTPWESALRAAVQSQRELPKWLMLRLFEHAHEYFPPEVRCTTHAVFLEVGIPRHVPTDHRDQWRQILSVLKRSHGNPPLQGVVLVAPIPLFLRGSDEDRRIYAEQCADYLAVMRAQWGFSIPVVGIFTVLEYFSGSVAHVGGEVQGAVVAWMEEEYQKICRQSLERMASAITVEEKMATLLFPMAISLLFTAMKAWCVLLSRAALPWREIYLAQGQCAVDSPLLQTIVQKKSPVLPTIEKKRKQRYLQWAQVCVFMLIVLSFIPLFHRAFLKNQALLEKAQSSNHQLLLTLTREGRTPTEIAKAITQSFSEYHALMKFKKESAFWERAGLYLGNKVRAPLEDIHLRVLSSFFMPLVGKEAERQLALLAVQWSNPANRPALRGDYYRLLKAYLMICFPRQLEVSSALSVMAPLWQQAWAAQGVVMDHGGDSLTLAQFIPPAAFYLQRLAQETQGPSTLAWTLDEHLVEEARAALRTPFNVYNLYADMKSHGMTALGNVTLTTDPMFEVAHQHPLFFTAKAWRRWIMPEIKKIAQQGESHDWITEMPLSQLSLPREQVIATARQKSVDALREALMKAYLADYVRAWWETVSGLSLTRDVTLRETSKTLGVWADPRGPLATLSAKIAENFSPPEIAAAHPALASLSMGKKTIAADPLLQSYFALLSKMQTEVETLALSADPARDAAMYTRRLLSGEATESALYRASFMVEQRVKTIASPLDQAIVRHVLSLPLKLVWHVLLRETSLYLDPLWQSQVYQPYRQTLLGKFPFADSENDVSFAEVGEVLRPREGRIAKFVHETLQPFLVQDPQGWQARRWLGEGLAFSPTFLEMLAESMELGRALYGEENLDTKKVWQFYPEPQPELSQVTWEMGGQSVRYYNGPQEWLSLHWPGKHPAWGIEITGNGRGHSVGSLSYKGAWGMIRLMRSARVIPLQGNMYRVVCEVPTNHRKKWQIAFRVRTVGEDLIQHLVLHRMTLPPTLFTASR